MVVRLWLAVLMAELLTVVASWPQVPDLPTRESTTNMMPVILPYDEMFTGQVTKSKTYFHILVHQNTNKSLYMTVTPCNTRLNWELLFVPRTTRPMKLGKDKPSKNGKLLVEYTGVSIPVVYDHGRAYQGLYLVSVQAVDEESQVMIYVTLREKSQQTRSISSPIGMKIKRKEQKISLRWNLSHIDHHLMEYCLVISTTKIYSTLCEAESRLKEKEKWTMMSNYSDDELPLEDRLEIHNLGFSTNYTLTDLIYDKTYYFTVFTMNGSHMAMQHANATYKYQRPKPIALKDAKPQLINLRAQGGKASFRYKIGRTSLSQIGNPNTLYWYIMPCGGVVNIEIRNKKSLLVKKRVFGYEKIVLNNTKFGERYVLKVETVTIDETQHVSSIEVLATVRPTYFPMPDMPNDLSLKQYSEPKNCQMITIGWLPAKAQKDLRYCVYVEEYTNSNSVDFSARPDQCELSYTNIRRHNIIHNRKNVRCYINENKKVLTKKIFNLKPSSTYVIQVTVTKLKGRTLSYDLLKLDTNSCELN